MLCIFPAVYYAFNISLVMTSIVLSGIVVKVSNLGETGTLVPHAVKVVFIDVISRPLCLYCQVSKVFNIKLNAEQMVNTNIRDAQDNRPQSCPPDVQTDTADMAMLTKFEVLDNRFCKLEELMTKYMSQGDQQADILMGSRLLVVQWRNISAVLDRVCIVSCMLAIGLSLIFLFPRPV